ncbi:MAG: c-type cytochrome, partial [Sphingobacteriales bacterium]
VSYSVKVVDKGAAIDLTNLYVAANFIKGTDLAGANLGHQVVSETMQGKNLMLSLDCKACHATDQKSVGPSFKAIADKYMFSPDANSYLPNKIIKGGAGVWGEVSMPAHPSLKEAEARQIVVWIRSLVNEANKVKSLPAVGTVTPKTDQIKGQNMVYSINANYTDAGAYGIRPLSGAITAILRNPAVDAGEFKNLSGFIAKDSSGSKYLVFPVSAGSFKTGNFDITGVNAIELTGYGNGHAATYTVEVHSGSTTGPKIGSGTISFTGDKKQIVSKIALQAKPSAAKPAMVKLQDYYIVVKQTTSSTVPPYLKTVRFVAGK